MIRLEDFPALNASLNGLAGIWIVGGLWTVKRRALRAHKVCMLAATATSTLFLACYLWYHAHHGATKFTTPGLPRIVYLTILVSHTVLAVVVVPLVLVTLWRAFRGDLARHRRIARWTAPIWLYVSITGVVVYLMLYRLYPPEAAR